MKYNYLRYYCKLNIQKNIEYIMCFPERNPIHIEYIV